MNLDYSQNRQRYIDIAKGILIICVVIGHVLNFEYSITTAIKTIIYTFHMPAFFIISGLLTNVNKWKNQSLGDFIKRKIKRLIIPYILFEIIGGIIQIFLYGFAAVNPVGILYGIVTIHCSVGADWFLPTLFFAELLMLFCTKILGNCCSNRFYLGIYYTRYKLYYSGNSEDINRIWIYNIGSTFQKIFC